MSRWSFRLSMVVALWLGAVMLLADGQTRAAQESRNPSYDLSRMEAFSWVLLQLKDDYVDPSRISPRKMLKGILEQVEQRVHEVELRMHQGVIDVQVGSQRKAFEVGEPGTVWEMNYALQPVFEFISKHLDPDTDPKDVEFAAINGMLNTLDPHSNLLPPELFREMQLKTTGEFGGLGIRITIRNGALTIISPLPDTPAARLGLKAMDQVVRIGDQSTVNMPLDEAVNLLRGPPGSKVTIWVMRPGWSEPHKFSITRETIRVRSIVSQLLDNNVAYIQIQDFGRHTAGDLLRHLGEMKHKAPKGLKGLVLDLRNNAGGLLKAAVQVADMFLDRGIIVATVAYGDESSPDKKVQKSREEQRAREDGGEQELPVVVLVNSGSASASEILAGALKNLDRGVLLGERTFGKGTVQILNERVPESVQGACLKLTVAEYLIPGDISIQEIGVTPDIQLYPVTLDKDSVQAFSTRDRFREEDIPVHLKTQKTLEMKPAAVLRYLIDEEPKADKDKKKKKAGTDEEEEEAEPPLEEPGFKEDFDIKLAKELIVKVGSPKASEMIDRATALLRENQALENEKISKKMKALGLDWSVGSSANAKAEAKFALVGEGVDAQGRALPDKEVKLRLSVKNTGTDPFYQLRAESTSKNLLFEQRELLFGKVAPGETRTWEVLVKVPRSMVMRADDIRFSFACEQCTAPAPLQTILSMGQLPRPSFGFNWYVNDSEGNNDGLIEPGEKVELEVGVFNMGEGKAFRAKALIKNDSGKDLFIEAGKGQSTLKEIPAKEARIASFGFSVPKDTSKKELPVELTVWDSDLGVTQVAKIKLPVNTGSAATTQPVKSGLKVKGAKAELRAWPDAKAPLVGNGKKNAALLTDRVSGNWFRVIGANNLPLGWASADAVKKIPADQVKTVKPDAAEGIPVMTPPLIHLENVPGYVEKGDSVRLKGKIEDPDFAIKDVAVWVGDDKIYLRPGSPASPHSMPLDVNVPLKPGANIIAVIAREGSLFSTQKVLVVTRPGGLDWKDTGEEGVAAEAKPATKKPSSDF